MIQLQLDSSVGVSVLVVGRLAFSGLVLHSDFLAELFVKPEHCLGFVTFCHPKVSESTHVTQGLVLRP